MNDLGWRSYLVNCGLLLLPIFIWNAALTRFLPPAFTRAEFWRDIPAALSHSENAFRLIVSVLPFFMPLELKSAPQRSGLVVFGVGMLLYFGAWAALIVAPRSSWAGSGIGFLAPALTPLLWLLGLALIGRRLYFGRFYRWWMFLLPTAGFIALHVAHTAIVYGRTRQ
jgi:hypothetical protein